MTNHSLDLPTTAHASEGPDNDGFFEPLGNTTPYLKAILEGFPGSGKTLTGVKLAIGLHRRIGSKKPIVFVSSEKAGKFLLPFFDEAGIKVLQRETRSPADLQEAMKRCRLGLSDIVIVDSISHFWEEWCEAYKRKLNRRRLEMLDWGIVKPEWKKTITDPFVNDPYHCIMTGRAGYEYDSEENEENPKKRDIFKSGVKMKAEGELAYEPDILVLMERHEDTIKNEEGQREIAWRTAKILKDRSTLIDGKEFRNPDFADFEPAIERLLAGAVRSSTTPALDTSALFRTEEDKRAWFKRRDIALETIEADLTAAWPGTGGDAKALKIRALKQAYGTAAWTAIQSMPPERLEGGVSELHTFIKGQALIAAVDSDLITVWPGTSADARSARAAALKQAFGVTKLDDLEAKSVSDIEAGIEALKKLMAEPEGSEPKTGDVVPIGSEGSRAKKQAKTGG